MELIIENIRCFAGRHTIPIKPITFLTGENSSGKSTILAALSAMNDYGYPMKPLFNEAPYNLGNYDTIATYKGGSYGRAKTFKLGYRLEYASNKRASEVVATYEDRQGLVEIASLELKNDLMTAHITLKNRAKGISINVKVSSDGLNFEHKAELDNTGRQLLHRWLGNTSFLLAAYNNDNPGTEPLLLELDRMLDDLGTTPTISISPVRTKPKRTYDQLTEEFSPEGEHIPFVLSDVLVDANSKSILETFGQEAGLFREISVKKLGSKLSDPVQVMITNSGRPANLVDVGYGVSQALPIVVESMLVSPQRLLLLQQPEVHLHPRAQAALGTLFVDLHQSSNKQFVIETHSDYIIDRVRQEIANGHIAAGDVQILYFEKKGTSTQVFPILLDKQGNVLDAPPSYRDFFFQEEVNLLSRAGV